MNIFPKPPVRSSRDIQSSEEKRRTIYVPDSVSTNTMAKICQGLFMSSANAKRIKRQAIETAAMFSKWKASSKNGRTGARLIQRETTTSIKTVYHPSRQNAWPQKLGLGQSGVLKDHVKEPVPEIRFTSIVEHVQTKTVAMERRLRPVPRPEFYKIWLFSPLIFARDALELFFGRFRAFLKFWFFRIFPVSCCVKSGRWLWIAKF